MLEVWRVVNGNVGGNGTLRSECLEFLDKAFGCPMVVAGKEEGRRCATTKDAESGRLGVAKGRWAKS